MNPQRRNWDKRFISLYTRYRRLRKFAFGNLLFASLKLSTDESQRDEEMWMSVISVLFSVSNNTKIATGRNVYGSQSSAKRELQKWREAIRHPLWRIDFFHSTVYSI